jgi:selenocysteine lyase/cysteine desulfurase
MDVRSIRESIPALGRCTYLNCGTFGPNPTPVADEVVRMVRLTEAEGPFNPDVFRTVQDACEQARAEVASLVGAAPPEIALTRNVSDGINIVATGFDWQPGDEVIISDEEHPSGALPWMNLTRRKGVVVRLLPLTPIEGSGYGVQGTGNNTPDPVPRTLNPLPLLERLERLLNPRTRLVFISHVSTRRGIRTPVADICRLVRSRGIPIMVDGAHSVGAVPVDVKAIGCDFYAGCGHKWLLAPQGTGFLYVSREWLDVGAHSRAPLQLTWLGWGMTSEYDLPNLTFEPVSEARRFEYGTRNWGMYVGLSASIKFARQVGLQGIYARSQKLATQLKQRLSDIPGVEVLTPLDPDASAGLVAISTGGLRHPNPGQWLWDEHRILVAHNPEQKWMRLSAAYFLLEEELDKLAERLGSLAGSSLA